MNMTSNQQPDRLIVSVQEQRLDAAIATQFKDKMREMTAGGGDTILLDLRNVQFMDSSGLGAIISVHKGLPASRRLELAGLTPNVERVFKLTRMDTIFTIHDALPEGGNSA